MTQTPKSYTKQELISELKKISEKGWIRNIRQGNQGGIGNTLEDLLGIEENNLPIPNAAEWELKTKRASSSAPTTLLHMEPSPRGMHFVPRILLPLYGWSHQEAGSEYPENEMSFRQTIHGQSRSDRGFKVVIDREERKVLISFNAKKVGSVHREWLETVEERVGLDELSPQPYWGFDDLKYKAGTKLLNTFYIEAEVKKVQRVEHYHYNRILMLEKFSFEKFLEELERGNILVDFDARTGHNHGTKFRIRQGKIPALYEKQTIIL